MTAPCARRCGWLSDTHLHTTRGNGEALRPLPLSHGLTISFAYSGRLTWTEEQTLDLVRPDPPAPADTARPRHGRARRVISVAGGKGGIGKSYVAANLAIALARRGRKVVLIDADMGAPNLHTWLGLAPPRRNLSDFLDRTVARIEDLIVPTGFPECGLICGASDRLRAAAPLSGERMRLLRDIHDMDVDDAILDVGAGTHSNPLDLFLLADNGILVLVPEPIAIENTYTFMKAAFWRRVNNVVSVYGMDEVLGQVMGDGELANPVDVVAALAARDPEAGQFMRRQLERFQPWLIVNQARTPQDALLGDSAVAMWRKSFGLEMRYLGHVQHDEELWRRVRVRRPLTQQAPSEPSAQSFSRIADRLASLPPPLARRRTAP